MSTALKPVVDRRGEVTRLRGCDSVGDMETRRQAHSRDPESPRRTAASCDLIGLRDTRTVRRAAPRSLDAAPAPDPTKAPVELGATPST